MRMLLAVLIVFSSAVQSSQPRPFQLIEATIDDVRAALTSKQTTCRALVDRYLKRIEAYDKAGPSLNAVQTINRRAIQEADRLDAAFVASGPVGALHCVPILVKDQIETSDMPTTYGSAVFKDFVSQRDATIVTKLKQAGAVIVAKTTMGEFASGYLGSAFGIVRNAYDPSRMASGSSGGTGSGIAANFATVGIGEDTGGSVRGPAAVANLVGLRPTVPLVSRFGMLPARPSTDTIGPIGRSVRDVAIVLDVIAGYDANDPVTAESVGQVPATYTQVLTTDGLKGARVGVIREPLDPKVDTAAPEYKQMRAVLDRALADLRRLGAVVVDAAPIPELAVRSSRLYDDNVFETEAATNQYLAQHANAPAKTLAEILLSGKVVAARARTLMPLLGHSTSEAGYLQLLLAREQLRQAVLSGMANQRLDALAYATFDFPPPKIPADALTRTTIDATGQGNNRRLSPVLGFPAITIPAGFAVDGLPVGLELMGRAFAEPVLLKLAYAYEQGTHHRQPPASTPSLTVTSAAAPAAEIAVMTSGAFTAAYLELAAEFERATGHRVVTEATSMGSGSTGIAARLERGEAIDVVIIPSQDLEQLMKSGSVRAETRVDLAKSAIGMAVRHGAPRPDISSVDALRRTLLEAKSIAYSASVSGSYLSTELFQRLGIADRVLPKSRKIEGERVGAVVARGDAEIGFQQISELLPVPGIDFVGPLPPDVQRVTVVSAGIGAAAKNPGVAKTFIDFLASPAAAAAIKKSALEAVTAAPNKAGAALRFTLEPRVANMKSPHVASLQLEAPYE